jgi:hypothetical protein
VQTPPPSQPETPAPISFPCRHLRSKEMFYQGDEEDEFSSGIYWCLRTQEPVGPDGEPAGKKDCCMERSCFLL